MGMWCRSISSPRPASAHSLNSSFNRSATLILFLLLLYPTNAFWFCLPPTSCLLPLCYPCALMSQAEASDIPPLYCPKCAKEVDEPLVCGDCSAVICKRCGSPLEAAEDLGMG